ncbi:TIGR04206 family protein [Halorientalis salina]|uniref:TIGR04206 family protein n=1 Tax=Halorientalis salina TaxID=2932266 RepID=UPI0010ABBAE2|nr:TIGR04206 family protein [Halorientalis salina]
MATPRRRLLAVLVLAVVPWTVVFARGTATLFFPFGFVTPEVLSFTAIWDYYLRYTAGPGSLPQYLVAYGIAAVLLGIALVNALSGRFWREDARVTAAVLVLAGLSNVLFAVGFLRLPGYTAVPVGTVLCWGVVWRYYGTAFRRILFVAEHDSD